MDKTFHIGNRVRLYETMETGSVLVLFSGGELRRSADAYYPFYPDRNFVYLTGIQQKNSVFLAIKCENGSIHERLYLLPKDAMAERWTGRRLDKKEAEALSGIADVRTLDQFDKDFAQLTGLVYLDLYKESGEDPDKPSHIFAGNCSQPVSNINGEIRRLRTVKQPCEIEALRKAEAITREGILAMMRASKPGMYEYQYKAEFDRALGQYSPKEAGFQSIISAGGNNFCIHYDSYTGIAMDGDLILNDVGAQWDNLIVDVSRSWPCNGKFTERQRLLYECALKTSDYLFSIIRPGMKMQDVDRIIREYNAALLVEAGVMESVGEVGKYMWHGGSHHIGYDVHDAVLMPEYLAPGMVFCVDVGIYHEEWGIGFRLEDNCLVTETGCENLSANIPRTIAEIEAVWHNKRKHIQKGVQSCTKQYGIL